MDRHLDGNHVRNDSAVTEHQSEYTLNRLTAAANELSRLIEIRPSRVIERVLADLDNAAEYTTSVFEAVQELRLWRADYHWLAAELDTAARSFHLAEQQLGRRIDAAVTEWEQQVELATPGTTGCLASAMGRQGRLRGLLRRGHTQAPLVTRREAVSPEQSELTPDPLIAHDPSAASPEARGADIAARVLGPLELTVAGMRVLRWSSLKARAVFQYLLMHQGRPIRREVLMELEWPNHSYNSARNNLNVALCSLRNTLRWGELDVQAILHKEGCYTLNPALTCWIDRNEFLSWIHDGQRARQAGSTQRAMNACRSAVQLYRGPLFEDDLAGGWYLPERRQLKELYLQALEYITETYCDRGQLQAAIEFGQRAMSADPCYEAVHRLLMRCYARQHQQQLVSRQFRLCSAALHDELDVSPTAETVQLFHALTSTT
jgi:DNA-binding SARP family transcriptional activator